MIKSFKVKANTPIGTKEGIISFTIKGKSLSGTIECMGEKVNFSQGTFLNNTFEFSGVVKKFFHKIPYTAKGSIENNSIMGTAFTNYGNISINGTETYEI